MARRFPLKRTTHQAMGYSTVLTPLRRILSRHRCRVKKIISVSGKDVQILRFLSNFCLTEKDKKKEKEGEVRGRWSEQQHFDSKVYSFDWAFFQYFYFNFFLFNHCQRLVLIFL